MRFIYTKAFAIFASCLAVLALAVFLQTKGWLTPVQYLIVESPRPVTMAVSAAARPVAGFFKTIYQLRSITEDNTALQTRVIQFDQELVQYDELVRENDALRAELGFVHDTKLNPVPCTVLTPSAFGFTDAITINCGSAQNVQEGQAVISEGYLVGKIVKADKNISTVLLATSAQFSTDARLSQSGVAAIAEGSFDSGMVLDQLPQNQNVSRGDMVVTAGISQQIQKNIPIGEVGEILSAGNELFKKTTLISPVDFNTLQFVFVAE